MDRRDFLLSVSAAFALSQVRVATAEGTAPRKGRIKQGVTRGVFARGMALEDACREAARLGIRGFDLDRTGRLADF